MRNTNTDTDKTRGADRSHFDNSNNNPADAVQVQVQVQVQVGDGVPAPVARFEQIEARLLSASGDAGTEHDEILRICGVLHPPETNADAQTGPASECGSSEPDVLDETLPTRPYPDYAEWAFKYLHQTTPPRSWCLRVITWSWFERISILVIVLNCITLACYRPCEDFNKCDSSRCQILTNLDHCIFAFFLAEMIVKVIAMGFIGPSSYLSEAWNRFDFIIILVGLVEYVVSAFGQSSGINLTAIRTARVLRPLRAINRIPSLRILVTLLLDTLPMLGNVLLLCFFVFFIFGIMGVQLWSSSLRHRCHMSLNRSVLQQYSVKLERFYYGDQEQDFLCSKPEADGMRKCDKVPAYRDPQSGIKCSLTVEAFEMLRANVSLATDTASSAFTQLNTTSNTSATHCINWHIYYSECIPSDRNPFMGAISFDNIGFAWVTIFQVISLESWVDIMYSLQDTFSYWSWIYFVFLIVIGAFFMINLCLVVIATQFSETKKREIERMRQERLLSTSSLASSCDPTGSFYKQLMRLIGHYLLVAKGQILAMYNRAMGRVVKRKSRSTSVLQLRKQQQTQPQEPTPDVGKSNANGVATGATTCQRNVWVCYWNTATWHVQHARDRLRVVVQHTYTQRIVLLAILVNTLSMGIEHYDQPAWLTQVLEYTNIFFTSLFAVEMVLKIGAFGLVHYVSNAFNVFDAVIVVLSIVELCQDGASGISVLRTFRLLRIFKVVRFLPALKRQLVVMLRTIDNVATFFILLLIFIFVFGVLGMNLFGCEFCTKKDGILVCDRKNFDSFLWAMVTVFQILTQEDWNSVLYMGMARTTPWASLYFVALMTFGNYVLFNLLVAILVEGFSSEKARLVEFERRAQERAAKAKDANNHVSDYDSASPSIRSGSSVFMREGYKSPNRGANGGGGGRGQGQGQGQNGALENGACRGLHRTPVPTIIHTPATPSHQQKHDCEQPDSRQTAAEHKPEENEGHEGECEGENKRTLSELLLSASRKPSKPFMPPDVSLESIDNSVVTLNCLCSPNIRRVSSKQSSSGTGSQLLNPAIVSHSSLRMPRKSILCLAKRRRSESDDILEPGAPDPACACVSASASASVSGGSSCESELARICADHLQLSQYALLHACVLDTHTHTHTLAHAHAHAHDNQADRIELRVNEPLGVEETRGDAKRADQTHQALLPRNKIAAQLRVALECFKMWMSRRRDHALFLFDQHNKFRRHCKALSEAKWFDYVILAFIIANCVALALENPHIPTESVIRQVLTISNYIFTTVFTFEMVIKIVASGFCIGSKPYASSGWNRMDFFLVTISLIDLIVILADGGSSRIFAILRVFRLLRTLRPLRVINRAPGLKLVVQTLLSSLKPIGNIVLICCTFFIIFGILGVQLFKGKFFHCDGSNLTLVTSMSDCLQLPDGRWINHQYNFDNLGQALIALFVLASKDGWVEIMYHGLDAVGEGMQPIRNYSEWRLLYFICFLLLVGFFVLNMFVGVVVENFQKCRAEQEAEDHARKVRRRIAKITRQIKKLLEHPYWENYPEWRFKLHKVVTSKYFDLAIAGVIGLNVISMAMEFYLMPKELRTALEVLNYVFTSIFILEALFRMLAIGPRRYVMERWNQLDIFIVILSIVGIALEDDDDENKHTNVIKVNPTIIRVFRVMRIARVLKLLKMAKGIRQLLDTVVQALPQVGNLGLLFFLLFYIFAALGVELFSRIDCDEDNPCVGMGRHANFKSFGNAFLTLFRIATGDNWNGIMKDTLRDKCDDRDNCQHNCCIAKFIPPLFFVVFVLVAQFVLVNVVIAVLMRHLQDAHRTAQDDKFLMLEEANVETLARTLAQMPDLDEETLKFLEELKPALSQDHAAQHPLNSATECDDIVVQVHHDDITDSSQSH